MTWPFDEGATGPLRGIRVLDLSSNILGPVATQILGDMGANVIKIEAPAGDPNRQIGVDEHPNMGALFVTMNRNKRSVVLDLKAPEGHDLLMRMVEEADVLVHSMREKAAERLRISYAQVVERNPRIIYAYARGYQKGGPHRDRPAYDDVIQGESGVASLYAEIDGAPRYVPMALADKFCGHSLSSAIGMALFERERSGKGQEIQLPMLETMLSFVLIDHMWMAGFQDHPTGFGYPRMFLQGRRPYATKDSYLCLMANNDDQWRRLFLAIDHGGLAEDPRYAKIAERSKRYGELYEIIGAEMAKRTTSEWRRRLDAADVPNAPVRMLGDLPNDPYLTETKFFQTFPNSAAGPIRTTSIPTQFSRTPGSLRRPSPGLGEHTREVLEAFGSGGPASDQSRTAVAGDATARADGRLKNDNSWDL